jgi:hypothetical protein
MASTAFLNAWLPPAVTTTRLDGRTTMPFSAASLR